MIARFFKIEALTNLHVGSGEINYGLIDNLIQRDPVTELPNINSSSLKGALREYFKYRQKNNLLNGWTVSDVFGSDPKDDNNRKQGSVRFFEAELLAIPVRDDKKPYIMVSCQEVVKSLMNKVIKFGREEKLNNCNTVELFVKDQLGILSCEYKDFKSFKDLCSDEELPVISRNYLDNGQSANLWYEQVLPKHSILCFAVMGEGDAYNSFCKELGNSQVQIGANATIGYGYCKITEFFKP